MRDPLAPEVALSSVNGTKESPLSVIVSTMAAEVPSLASPLSASSLRL